MGREHRLRFHLHHFDFEVAFVRPDHRSPTRPDPSGPQGFRLIGMHSASPTFSVRLRCGLGRPRHCDPCRWPSAEHCARFGEEGLEGRHVQFETGNFQKGGAEGIDRCRLCQIAELDLLLDSVLEKRVVVLKLVTKPFFLGRTVGARVEPF